MTVRISRAICLTVLEHAASNPAREVCGLLVGGDDIERVVPTANVAREPCTGFEIDPSALFNALRRERDGIERLMGYYHSHPVGPPIPSATDTALAVADGRVWLIAGLGRVCAWEMTATGTFREIRVE